MKGPGTQGATTPGGALPTIAYVLSAVLVLAYLVAIAFAWFNVGEEAEA